MFSFSLVFICFSVTFIFLLLWVYGGHMSEARFMEINVGAKIKTPFDMQSVSKQIYQSLIREAEIFVLFQFMGV